MREVIATGKTTDEAIENACAQLGVERDNENVTVEVIDLPVKKLFRSVPAKVRVTLDEPEQTAPAAPKAAAPAPAAKPAAPAAPKAAPAAPSAPKAAQPAPAPAPVAEEAPVEIDMEADAKVKAAADYLRTVFAAMGVTEVSMTAVKSGEATIIRVQGDNVGVLIGHRGETMESLSYLASLVANRLPGDYLKLGLDVSGYRSKREKDLEILAQRHARRVIKTGRSFALEPMNPYERRIVHSAITKMEGVRSESRGEGPNRRVVIYSTDPNASNLPERERRPYNSNGPRGPRSGGFKNDRSRGGYNKGERGERRYGDRDRNDRGPRPPRSNVPEREFANAPRDPSAAPMAPKRTQRIDDAGDFALYGKIEL